MYACMCVCHCLTGCWLLYANDYICMYICIYGTIQKGYRDHSCGGMIYYVGEWHEEVPVLMRNQVGRVVMTDIRGQYHVVIN